MMLDLSNEIFSVTLDDDGIATVLWDVEGEPMNVFSERAIDAFSGLVQEIGRSDEITGVVIASAKTAFHAGADLKMVKSLFVRNAEDLWALMSKVASTFYALETCGKPVAAAIEGHALGGGFEMALACHARFAAKGAKGKIGLPEAAIGLMPGFGGTQRVARLMDFRRAIKDMIRGATYSADEAHALGLITDLAEPGEVIACAKAWIRSQDAALQPWMEKGYKLPSDAADFESFFSTLNARIAKQTWGNLPAQRLIADAVYHGLQMPIEPALRLEIRKFVELIRDPSAEAMVQTNFFAMKDARGLDRRPADMPACMFHHIGVIGAGLMGAGIAYAASMAGISVTLIDVDQAAAEKGKGYSDRLLTKDVQRGRISDGARADVLDRITATTDYATLSGCDLVVEAVFENAELKTKILRAAEAAMKPSGILASNTSTIPIAQLAGALDRPDQFLGLHFFSPVEKMPLLEIVIGAQTSQETLAAGFDIAKALGKIPIAVNDGRAFYTTRVVTGYMLEGLALLGEGVAAPLIENAGRSAGMPMGPLRLTDMINIDLIEKIEAQAEADLGTCYVAHPGRVVAQKLIDAGRLGEKTKAGFYDYDAEAPHLWHDLKGFFPVAAERPAFEYVENRLMYRQANEALRCFDDGVLSDARDADLGSVLGWGFASHTGGIARYIDNIGANKILAFCLEAEKTVGERFTPARKLVELSETKELLHQAQPSN